MKINRLIGLLLVFVLTFWMVFPAVSFAAFITPGTPITPGKAINPGIPIKGGNFIIPGNVYDPGTPIKDNGGASGSGSLISGQPIITGNGLKLGTFIIPNAPPVIGNPFQTGLMNGGTVLQGGQGPNGGNAAQGGQGPNGGTAAQGGQGPNGGTAAQGGQGPNGGTAAQGGQGSNGGTAAQGGQGPNRGNVAQGGQGPNGGNVAQGGQGPNGGNAAQGGQGPNGGNAAQGGQGSNGGNTAQGGNNTTGSNGNNGSNWLANTLSSGLGMVKNFKRWGLDFYFAADNIAQGLIAHGAGYKFVENSKYQSGHKFKYLGDRKVEGKVKQKYLDKFSSSIKDNKRNYNSFEKKQYLRDKGLLGFKETLKKSIREKWLPFYKKETQVKVKGSKVPKVESKWMFNKDILKGKSLLKGSAPVNFALTFGGTLIDYTLGDKKSQFNTPDFYADLSTDATIGVGTTLISSLASSMAVGAVSGSVVPGLGTAVGAVAGLLAGVGTYFFLQTGAGIALKTGIRKGFKKTYQGISKAGKWIGSKFKSGFSKLGGIFG